MSKAYTAFLATGKALDGAAQIALSEAMAAETAMTNAGLALVAQEAAQAAAVLKMSNDLNDAQVSFMKNIGSSIKSAAQ